MATPKKTLDVLAEAFNMLLPAAGRPGAPPVSRTSTASSGGSKTIAEAYLSMLPPQGRPGAIVIDDGEDAGGASQAAEIPFESPQVDTADLYDVPMGVIRKAKALPDGTRLLFAYIGGSVSYNVNLDLSDKDYFGVYICPTDELLSLSPPTETLTKASKIFDYSLHEVGKYARLLLKGNPGIIEALFYPGPRYSTPAWEALRARRHDFLSNQVLGHYLGYVSAQIKQYHDSQKIKKLYHAIRLCAEAERILAGGEPVVRLEGEERERMMRIRRGEESPEDLLAEVDRRVDAIKAAKPWPLREQGSEEAIYDWLLDLRNGAFDDDE